MESAMDFHCLSRRELQALCKKNKIPANMTNAAMADALQNLQHVEGLEEINTPSETSPEKLTSAMKSVPRTATRRKPMIIIDPETPAAVPSTRRKAPAAAASARPKTESVAYSTRRSVRLAEKQLSELCLNDNKGKKLQDDFSKEMNESADDVEVSKTVSESSYTKEVSDAFSEITNNSEAVSALNQMEVSSVMSVEKEMAVEVKIDEGVDVQTKPEVEPKVNLVNVSVSDDSDENSPTENLQVPNVIVTDEMDFMSEKENEEEVKIEENHPTMENSPTSVENLQIPNVMVTDEIDIMSENENEEEVSAITEENHPTSVKKMSPIHVMSSEELKGEIPFTNWAVDPQLGHIPRPAQLAPPLKSSNLLINDLVLSENEELNKENAEKLKVKKMEVSDDKASTPLEKKSLRQIRKMLKSKLEIKCDLKNNAAAQEDSEQARTALQVLPENFE